MTITAGRILSHDLARGSLIGEQPHRRMLGNAEQHADGDGEHERGRLERDDGDPGQRVEIAAPHTDSRSARGWRWPWRRARAMARRLAATDAIGSTPARSTARAASTTARRADPCGRERDADPSPGAAEQEKAVDAEIDAARVLEDHGGADRGDEHARDACRAWKAAPHQQHRESRGHHRDRRVGLNRDARVQPVGQTRQIRRRRR